MIIPCDPGTRPTNSGPAARLRNVERWFNALDPPKVDPLEALRAE